MTHDELEHARTEAFAASAREGALAERARVRAILDHDAACERPTLALALAVDTDMPAVAACQLLAAAAVERPAARVWPTAAVNPDSVYRDRVRREDEALN